MLNVLISAGKQKFRREDFLAGSVHHGLSGPRSISIQNVEYPYNLGTVTVAMDPTGGINKDSDTCGISAFWWHPTLRFAMLLDFFNKEGVDPKTQLETLYEMGAKWNADILITESGSMQVWVESWLKDLMTDKQEYFRLHPYHTRGVTKGRRILDAFQPYVANHQVFVVYPEHEAFVDHMVSLNIAPDGTVLGSSPALADTCAMHAEWWEPGVSISDAGLQTNVVDEDEFENARRQYGAKRTRYGLMRRTSRGY
jgi:hypothetical protein